MLRVTVVLGLLALLALVGLSSCNKDKLDEPIKVVFYADTEGNHIDTMAYHVNGKTYTFGSRTEPNDTFIVEDKQEVWFYARGFNAYPSIFVDGGRVVHGEALNGSDTTIRYTIE